MKEKYMAPSVEIIDSMSINTFYGSSDIFFEDNEGYSPVFRP